MLDEFMKFNDKKMPPPNTILKPKDIYSKKVPVQVQNRPQKPKKQSIVNIEGLEELKQLEEETLKLIKEQEALSLAEQIMRRQQEEEENKRREILKQLHKTKTVDLNKFLTRTIGFEQKKNYDLEQKRFKKLEEESKLCKERPILSNKTEKMCKISNKKPIHERTKEIIEKREKKINDLKYDDYNVSKKLKLKKMNKDKNAKANNSMDKINMNNEKKRKRKEYIINEKTKNRKMNNSEMADYYNRQYEWKNRLAEKTKLKVKNQKLGKGGSTTTNEEYFHPHICQGTIEIINAKNEANEMNNGYQKTDYNNNYYYVNNDNTYQNRINLGKNVYDRLYEENAIYEMKRQEYRNKSLCSFQPYTNKNKYKQIQPKYNDINKKNKKRKKRTRNNKSDLRGAKSVEVNKTNNETIEIKDKNNNINTNEDSNNKKKGKDKNISEPWTNTLLKLKNNKNNSFDDDCSYRLNIRQGSAWNENDVNIVPLRGGSREIIKYFI